MDGPEARILPDGRRLHLHHGPIDLIVEAFGKNRVRALKRAEARFQTILDELVAELDLLRAPLGSTRPEGVVAQRMAAAVAPYTDIFVTPMAAVAGAVADEVCAAMCAGLSLDKAYVNNGGDIAVHLGEGQALVAALYDAHDIGRVRLVAHNPARGLATSGWRGRSFSLGIADAVCVVAGSAAVADVAATLIANGVDLPGHPGIRRTPAVELAPDNDLGTRLVTVAVSGLNRGDVETALAGGVAVAQKMQADGQIGAAALFLQGEVRLVGAFPALKPA